ncbi:hypothetical protein GCM10007901_40300 [Dyella acidisoli]|uniref:Uncharacterized protein n=1 Tax=Dyella acidisoli TaxID=1867834 RepID=A0ABQ5XTN4_9GAMM|nr:hypothetical protein GCM10007901_40300 [Dyella acidisoli]
MINACEILLPPLAGEGWGVSELAAMHGFTARLLHPTFSGLPEEKSKYAPDYT